MKIHKLDSYSGIGEGNARTLCGIVINDEKTTNYDQSVTCVRCLTKMDRIAMSMENHSSKGGFSELAKTEEQIRKWSRH